MYESIDLLRCHFGLTPAEARLALHLVAGETLRCAAVKLSITYETARTQLKKIFNKTGTCRQAELVIVILTTLSGRALEQPTSPPEAWFPTTKRRPWPSIVCPKNASKKLEIADDAHTPFGS